MESSEQVTAAQPDQTLLANRVAALERQVAELTRQLDLLSGRVAKGAAPAAAAGATVSSPLLPESIGEQVTPAMERIITRMNRGENEAAFADLRAIPEDELATQPVSVALVAAALCLKRGDREAGLRAVQQVRALTDDPRVLRILKKLEQHSTAD